MGLHILVAELDYTDWFSIAPGLYGCQFTVALVPYGNASSNEVWQHTSGLEVLAYNFNNVFNCLISLEQYILMVTPVQSIISSSSTKYSFGKI